MIIYVNGTAISDYLVNDITFNYDAVASSFSLSLPYFEYWPVSKRLFRPLKFQRVEIWDDSHKIKLLTGTIINNKKKATPNGVDLAISGYSLPGILEDCPNVPDTSTTSKELTLKEHAENLLKPFGIKLVIDEIVKAKCNEAYSLTTTKNDESISKHLSSLCTLKNIVITSDAEGNLVFTQIEKERKPRANFSIGDANVISIELDCQGQAMHSEIKLNGATGLYEDKKTDTEKTGESGVITNPLVAIYKPNVINQGTEINSIADASKAALANELKAITLTIEVRDWKVVESELLLPGDLITVTSPQIGLYEKTVFLIRSLSLKQESKVKASTLVCVIPETMTGEQPKIVL
jgi:prophage tail gpP-like protein